MSIENPSSGWWQHSHLMCAKWYRMVVQTRTTLQFTGIFGRVKEDERFTRCRYICIQVYMYLGIYVSRYPFYSCTKSESKITDFSSYHIYSHSHVIPTLFIYQIPRCCRVHTSYTRLQSTWGCPGGRESYQIGLFISDGNEGFNGSDAWRGKEGE